MITALAEFAPDRIFQRTGTARAVTFAGLCDTAPAAVEIRLLAADGVTEVQGWTAATLAGAGGGSWSASLAVPQGGWYRWQARPAGDAAGASPVSTGRFAVGVLVLCFGQSNMRHMWGRRTAPPSAHALTRRWAGHGWWPMDATAQGAEATALHGPDFGGNGGVVLGNLLQAGFGLPVGLLQLAVGATAIALWQAGGSCWQNLVAMLTADCGTDFEYALWHQGESDVSEGTAEAAYRAGLEAVVAQTRALCGRPALPFGIAITGRRAGGPDGYDMIRRVQRDVIAQDASAFLAGSSLDSVLVDGIHWDTPSYERMARRYAQSVLAAAGLATHGAAGPRITAATRQRGTAVVALQVQQAGGGALRDAAGGTSGAGLTGFRLLRNGIAQAIGGTAFAGNAIRLTLAAPPNGGAWSVTYQAGAEPDVSAAVHDDAPPQGDTRGVPLQPTFAPLAVVATEESIMSGTGGSFFGSFVLPSASLSADRWLLRLDDGTDGNVLGAVVPAGGSSIVPRVVKAGAVTDGPAAGSVAANALQRVSLAVSGTSLRVSVDGAEPVVQAHDLTGCTLFRLGANAAGNAVLGGECGGLRLLPFAVSDAGQARLTAFLP